MLTRNPDGSIAATGSEPSVSGALHDEKENIKSLVTEEVTPINQKCLARALRPPVTLKTFFKSVGQKQSDKVSETMSKCVEISYTDYLSQQDNGNSSKSTECDECSDVKPADGSDPTKSSENEHDIENSNSKGNLEVKSTNVSELAKSTENENVFENSNSKGDNSTEMDNKDSKASTSAYESTNCSQTLSDSNTASQHLSRKRAVDESFFSPRQSKRPRQSTIMSSFAKATVKKEEKKICPICGKEFDSSVKNMEVNQHIDNCLIE